MSEVKVYPVPTEVAAHAWINDAQYQEMYKRSVDDPEGFWAEQATTASTAICRSAANVLKARASRRATGSASTCR
jgi:hypothetical protein